MLNRGNGEDGPPVLDATHLLLLTVGHIAFNFTCAFSCTTLVIAVAMPAPIFLADSHARQRSLSCHSSLFPFCYCSDQ